LRRAAISVPTNIVEGCARRSPRAYSQFLLIAFGSAVELCDLVGVSRRLGFIPATAAEHLLAQHDHLARMLRRQVEAVDGRLQVHP
jgi:four helix bundle protein